MISSDNPEISLEEFLKFIKSGRVYNRKEVVNRINYTYYLGIDLDSYLNDKDSIPEADYKKMNTVYSHLLQEMKDGSILDGSENSLDKWASYFYNKKKDEMKLKSVLVGKFTNSRLKKYIEEYLDTKKKV